jgi:putative spermidine/putrescine transport system permease protein
VSTALARYGWPLVVALAWGVLLFLMLPTLVAVPVSLTPERYLSLPTDEISFQHYGTLFTDPLWMSSVAQSLVIGTLTAALSLVLGSLAAIGLWRLSSRLAETIRLFTLAPLIVPSVVAALAFYWFFSRLGLIDTFVGVILAHTVLAAPYVLVTVAASLATIDVRQEQASRSLGASLGQTVRYVILPQAKPGLVTGAIFAFLISWDEIVVTLFVASRTVYTLPRKMWDGIQERVDPTIAAAATVLFAMTVVLVLVEFARTRRAARVPAATEG